IGHAQGMAPGHIDGMRYERHAIRGANYLVGTAGGGPPLLLLHGFPQTHYCWRGIVPKLSAQHAIVAPDLRGYGATSTPPGCTHGQGFSKREMAHDLVDLMTALGHDRFAVIGHDRGARVAYRMALDHPDRVEGRGVTRIRANRGRVSHDTRHSRQNLVLEQGER